MARKGEAPPAAWYRFSADRKAAHPKAHLEGFAGWMHSDGYAGFGALARAGPVREVACLAHVRRKFFDVHAAQGSAIAAEALKRIATLYAIEKDIRRQPPEKRVAIRRARAAPRLDELERWLQTQLPRISAKTPPPAVPAARLPRWANRHPPRGFASRGAGRYTKPRGPAGLSIAKGWPSRAPRTSRSTCRASSTATTNGAYTRRSDT